MIVYKWDDPDTMNPDCQFSGQCQCGRCDVSRYKVVENGIGAYAASSRNCPGQLYCDECVPRHLLIQYALAKL